MILMPQWRFGTRTTFGHRRTNVYRMVGQLSCLLLQNYITAATTCVTFQPSTWTVATPSVYFEVPNRAIRTFSTGAAWLCQPVASVLPKTLRKPSVYTRNCERTYPLLIEVAAAAGHSRTYLLTQQSACSESVVLPPWAHPTYFEAPSIRTDVVIRTAEQIA